MSDSVTALDRVFGETPHGDPSSNGGPVPPNAAEVAVVTLEEFAAVDEPGASALLGDTDSALIPEGGDVMLYGDGGAGKTTLSIDLACHLAAGEAWLGISVPRPVRVLLIENEGPRPLLRRKLRRKLNAWTGPPLEDRIHVFSAPWGQFTLATPEWRAELAAVVKARAIDVVIAGPLTRIGMDEAGTLQEVVAFMELVAEVRRQCDRLLTVTLNHHENKGGAVSGAWEGAVDTLLHVQNSQNGRTVVAVQKARWSSELHGKTLHLAWTAGEGFELEAGDERDLPAEIEAYLREHSWRTAKEIAAPASAKPPEEPGIGANDRTVSGILKADSERFEMRTGDAVVALGRPFNTKVYSLRRPADAPDAPVQQGAFFGGAEEAAASLRPPLRDAADDERTPGRESGVASAPPTHPTHRDGGERD